MKIKLEHYVIFSIIMIILMTIAVMVLMSVTDRDFSEIYTVWCGIFGGEILSCALIKIFKIRGSEDVNGDM